MSFRATEGVRLTGIGALEGASVPIRRDSLVDVDQLEHSRIFGRYTPEQRLLWA